MSTQNVGIKIVLLLISQPSRMLQQQQLEPNVCSTIGKEEITREDIH